MAYEVPKYLECHSSFKTKVLGWLVLNKSSALKNRIGYIAPVFTDDIHVFVTKLKWLSMFCGATKLLLARAFWAWVVVDYSRLFVAPFHWKGAFLETSGWYNIQVEV